MVIVKDHAQMLLQRINTIRRYISTPDGFTSWEWREKVTRDRKTMDAIMFNFERAVDKIEKSMPLLNVYCQADWERFVPRGKSGAIISSSAYRPNELFDDAKYLCVIRGSLRNGLLAMSLDRTTGTAAKLAKNAAHLRFSLNRNARFLLNVGARELLAKDNFKLSNISSRLEAIEEYKKDLLKPGDDNMKTYDALMHHVRGIGTHVSRLSPLITDRFPAFKATKILDFQESKMRESVKPITVGEVIKAVTEYAPDLNLTVDLARKQSKDSERYLAKNRSFQSFLRLQKNETRKESFHTRTLYLVE